MIKAVIFDLDDTLISERQYIDSGYRNIAEYLSNCLNMDASDIYKILMRLYMISPKYVFNRFYDTLGINYIDDVILNLVNRYRNHKPDIEFYKDVVPLLNYLKNKGIKTGIISDGYAETQKQKLAAICAYDYFDEILLTDEMGREFWKPNPKAFEVMNNKLCVEFDEMVYIGDNPEKDFYISKVYPIRTIRIIRESSVYKNSEYYKGVKETETVYSLSEIVL